ncbi:MAG: cobalamin-dependent protein, partial [Phycisphaerales bacterium]
MDKNGSQPPRVLLAKIGLDGHDRGAKVLARSFRDAGIEVIYTGLWQTCESTMYAALQEDVDVVGVSLLSAAHMTVMPELLRIRKELGIEHIPVMLGGIVPDADHPPLEEMGIAAVFNPGSPIDAIVEKLKELAAERKAVPFTDARAGYDKGDVRALAKVITCVQDGRELDGWKPPAGKAKVIGVTGSPGVGKSSFIGKLGQRLRQRDKRVAVVAIDPSSPLTGGALLGDRLRMMTGTRDEQFFVRSLSSGGAAGGLSPHCADVVNIINGFGFDYILLETVGAGQADVAVREMVDQTMLLLMPESGDSIQFAKAGIVEIASCFVLNKCDLPGADATEAQLLSSVGDSRPIWKVST